MSHMSCGKTLNTATRRSATDKWNISRYILDDGFLRSCLTRATITLKTNIVGTYNNTSAWPHSSDLANSAMYQGIGEKGEKKDNCLDGDLDVSEADVAVELPVVAGVVCIVNAGALVATRAVPLWIDLKQVIKPDFLSFIIKAEGGGGECRVRFPPSPRH